MEMKRDYSGWFVKYHVNLNAVAANYPWTVRQNVQEIHHFIFSIMHVIHWRLGEKEESLLVLRIPGKFISYNLIDETFMDLGAVSHGLMNRDVDLGLGYSWEEVHPYVNTLRYLWNVCICLCIYFSHFVIDTNCEVSHSSIVISDRWRFPNCWRLSVDKPSTSLSWINCLFWCYCDCIIHGSVIHLMVGITLTNMLRKVRLVSWWSYVLRNK